MSTILKCQARAIQQLNNVFNILNFIYIRLVCRPVFPKVRSADHFWSSRFSVLVSKKKIYNSYPKKRKKWLLDFIFFSRIFIKLPFDPTKFIFLVRGAMFNDIMVLQNTFQCFMVRKIKKFGKH
jgi:hypothetical protein